MSIQSETQKPTLESILENKERLKRQDVLFSIVVNGYAKNMGEAEKLAKEASNIAIRSKDGRMAFYDWLKAGNTVKNVAELETLIKSGKIPFSDNQKQKANYSHWLAIAALVDSVRGN